MITQLAVYHYTAHCARDLETHKGRILAMEGISALTPFPSLSLALVFLSEKPMNVSGKGMEMWEL